MMTFREFVDSCSLIDMESRGCAFKWTNNRAGEDLVKERLDRAFCNLEWRLLFSNAEAFAYPAIGSYHGPILLCLHSLTKTQQGLFRFEAYWLDHPECADVVEKAWKTTHGQQGYLVKKTEQVTQALRKWSRKAFKNASIQLDQLRNQLTQITNSTDQTNMREEYNRITEKLGTLWRQEEMYWGIRSRINWLKWGDQNTKFFHATTIQRRQRNKISMLRLEENVWSREPQIIKQHITSYYKDLYSSVGTRYYQPILEQCPLVVSQEMNGMLISPITKEEVQQAVFQMGASKAPGPDGLSGLFYQSQWHLIQEDIFQMVDSFFRDGSFDPRLNETFITLIPKVANPESITKFRPISLCNFNYKVITKVMANRLKPWLPSIISQEQSAFVADRQIQDNIFIVQEVLHQLRVRKRRKKFQALLKLDMQKAYDRVEWDFLCDCMEKMGFNEKWVSLVRFCIPQFNFVS